MLTPPVKAPAVPRTTPKITPDPDTERRLNPDTICPNQKERVVRRITRNV